MPPHTYVALIHLVGFVTGIALYGMLAVMIRQVDRRDPSGRRIGRNDAGGGIPIVAAVLGLVWNFGALIAFGWHDLMQRGELSPWLTAASYSALGFLPAVVVDSATRDPARSNKPGRLALCAYALSAAATVLQARGALAGLGSNPALLTLTLGYGGILIAMLVLGRRAGVSHRPLAVATLAAFAASAFHLRHHPYANDSWFTELIGDHASLAFVLVILYQDFRFALADLFLKRALAMLALVGGALVLYTAFVAPLSDEQAAPAVRGPALIVGLWVITALVYPTLRRGIDRFVDRVVLRRADYRELRTDLTRRLSGAVTEDAALDAVCAALRPALSARDVAWMSRPDTAAAPTDGVLVTTSGPTTASVIVPTADRPDFAITVGALSSGRRLLSDDVDLMESVAVIAARRIDDLRVAEERYRRDTREQDMQRLATEAELQALRAQLNPHFLFNALTTIGHLVRTSPQRAVETLYQLTTLLRAVLRRVSGEFVTMGEEMHIVDSYLAIEAARFEERLSVERHFAPGIETYGVPPLMIQPLVENAIKHGIAPRREGGIVRLSASVDHVMATLTVSVADTGVGISADQLEARVEAGVGISNVRRRLDRYFGSGAALTLVSAPNRGTTATITIPLIVLGTSTSLFDHNDSGASTQPGGTL